MNKSDTIEKLAAALVRAQPLVEGAKKDSINPFFKSKYADLAAVWDAVRPALEANGLAVCQLVDECNGAPALTTTLIHESGQWISGTYPLAVAKPDAQSYGSAISYARRYGLAALMGVLSEDDDGENATRPAKPAAKADPVAIQTDGNPDRGKAILWAGKAELAINGIHSTLQMTSWLQANDANIEKVRISDLPTYNALTTKISIRKKELGG